MFRRARKGRVRDRLGAEQRPHPAGGHATSCGTFYYHCEFDLMDQLAWGLTKRRGRQTARRVAEFRPKFIVG